MEILRGKIEKAQKVTIYGPAGIGKSTFASSFPNPLFCDVEDSTMQMDVARMPKPSSWNMLLSQVDYVKEHPEVCGTLVLDTADWAEKLCIEHICNEVSNKTSLGDFDHGKGYVKLAEKFGRFLNSLSDVVDLGTNVVIVAHAQMRKFEEPNETGTYDRWELKMEKKVCPLIKEWSDMILFANYKILVINVDNQGSAKGKNKAQGGKRIMYTQHHPCWDAKNRHGLKEELPLEYGAIAHCIPSRTVKAAPVAPVKPEPSPSQVVDKPEDGGLTFPSYWHHPESGSVYIATSEEDISNDGMSMEIIEAEYERLSKKYAAEKAKPAPESKPDPVDEPKLELAAQAPPVETSEQMAAAGVPKALIDLMQDKQVSISDLQDAVAHKGHFPRDTPFKNYPADYVQGVLIAAWPQVLSVIEDLRVPF